jgi:hypothetical protein
LLLTVLTNDIHDIREPIGIHRTSDKVKTWEREREGE